MSGTMPVRQRNAAWEALKKAALRVVEAEIALEKCKEQERRAARVRLSKAKYWLNEVWLRFPECWGDKPHQIPHAIDILATIKRQEEAEEWAEKLKTWNVKKKS